ncbi:ketol-acid reductoisomerase [Tenggerimyces flavus]|uniref:Acetohydroxy-acid isomeroreductase n=1 Tax=Tenggerimyces flavus TaxID=1708749 RepID=A0ABV7YCV4_9ACTN|nr:ketol-acid reductoisomerase [Tenggerimyces flavus]MBM7789030.1 ketol-acid reductoisomerase [Tenggerimyces flavus]
MTFTSAVFDVETIELAGTRESIVRGGRHLFPLLPTALEGVDQIGVIGWGPQGRAQALNLRDSLADTAIEVVVGLRAGSSSRAEAEAEGLRVGDWLDVVASSQLVILLVADAATANNHEAIFERLQPGATLGLSHGFLVGHLRTVGASFPEDVNVIGVCPKGMGDSVRRLYLQGREINGAGINASFAVHQDVDGRATERALAWSIGLGSPYTFQTTLDSEYRSDIVGERAILLGAVHGIVESLYQRYRVEGDEPERAFARSAEAVTASIAPTISRDGLLGVRNAFEGEDLAAFDRAYAAGYGPFRDLVAEIYDEVDSGNELASVVLAGARLATSPMQPISGSPMWAAGASVRAARQEAAAAVSDPYTAGIFLAAMVAQVDLFAERGHPWSEIVNESVIEAVDSLLPYMHARDVAFMVDNCSTTARLGARKWGPRFSALLDQVISPIADNGLEISVTAAKDFGQHPVHVVLERLATLRPSVDISVG